MRVVLSTESASPPPEIPKEWYNVTSAILTSPGRPGENQSGWGLKLLSSLCFHAAKQIRKA
jgi:hypothetical protein